MGIIQEFKQFAIKGNVVDMAVGVIVGAAFGKIVSSLVADVVTPALGFLIGGVNFTHFELVLRAGDAQNPPVAIKYGVFLQSIFDFLIVSAAIFMAVKLINQLRHKEAVAPSPAPPAPTKEELLLAEIRDAVRALKSP